MMRTVSDIAEELRRIQVDHEIAVTSGKEADSDWPEFYAKRLSEFLSQYDKTESKGFLNER